MTSIIVAMVLCTLGLLWLVAEVWRPAADSKAFKLFRLVLLMGSAVALWHFLFPPLQPQPAAGLVVLSGGDHASLDGLPAESIRVALPEAGELPDGMPVERVTDLAAALRRYPDSTQLKLLGQGFGPRDLAAASALPTDFEPPAARIGIVELRLPAASSPGSIWSIAGRVAEVTQGRVQLVDPHGNPVTQAELDEQGGFQLQANSPVSGSFRYELRLIDAADETIEALSVPVQIDAAAAQRVLLWADAPNAEYKYLRRWALDSGQQLSSAINLRPRLSIQLGSPALSASALLETDLLIVDDRSWYGLPETQRQIVIDAVEGGLGLLLRITDDPDRAAQQRLTALGFTVDEAQIAREVRLPAPISGLAKDADLEGVSTPSLLRRPLLVTAPHSAILLSDDQGQALGRWRAQGDGRIGLLWVADTYALLLAGERSHYASLWSGLASTLGRAQAVSAAELIGEHHWVAERLVWCGLSDTAFAVAPDGSQTRLLTEQRDHRRCAGYWPAVSGWHQLRDGPIMQTVYVRSADDGAALRARLRTEANLALANRLPVSEAAASSAPGPRWPWFLLWLTLSGGLWWLERRAAAILLTAN